MSETSTRRGEFSVESFTLVNQHGESLNLEGVVKSFRLFESIYDSFCTGEVGIVDGLNLLYNYRFTGQEFIRISLQQKEGEGEPAEKEYTIDKTFRVYATQNVTRVPDKAGTQVYLLRLCDPRVFNCKRKRLSQVFTGSYDDILENVLVNWAKIPKEEFDTWTETTPNTIRYIAPNKSVSAVIDHVVSNASIGDNATYRNGLFFYETLNGGFRFKAIDEMFQDEFPLTFSMVPRTATDLEGTDVNAEGGMNTQILSWENPQTFDTIRGTIGGANAGLTKVYDPVRKTEADYVFDIEETWKRGKHLSGNPLIFNDEYEYVYTADNQITEEEPPAVTQMDVDLAPNKHFDAYVIPDYTMTHAFDNNDDVTKDEILSGQITTSNAKLERDALFQLLNQYRVKFSIPFRSDLSVGTIIKVDLPPLEPSAQLKQGVSNKLDDSRYLITHIAAVGDVQKKMGQLYIEGVKESYISKIADVKPLEERLSSQENV